MNDSLRMVNIRLFATSCFQLVEIHQLLSGCIDRFLSMTSRPVHTSLVRAASPLLLIMCPLISMHYISHWFLRVKLMSNALVPLHSSAGFSCVHQLHWRLPIDSISCMIILLFPNCIISSAVLPFPKTVIMHHSNFICSNVTTTISLHDHVSRYPSRYQLQIGISRVQPQWCVSTLCKCFALSTYFCINLDLSFRTLSIPGFVQLWSFATWHMYRISSIRWLW